MSQNEPIDYNTQFENETFGEFAEAHTALGKKYRVSYKLTKKDLKDWPHGKIGDIIFRNPDIPETPKEAFKLFTEYYAQVQFLLHKSLFIRKYKVWNKASVIAELTELDKWISEAKQRSYSEAVSGNTWHLPQYEYLRLKNGFYDGYKMSWQQHQDSSVAATVYGRYILLYRYLKRLKYGYMFTGSKYVGKIDIDYDDLPDYAIRDVLIGFFEEWQFDNPEDVLDWDRKWEKTLLTIPMEWQVKTIEKAVEYGQKVYEYHLANECYQIKNGTYCIWNETWERRIALAQKLFSQANIKNIDTGEHEIEQAGNPEFTTARQVLAIHYLLENCEVANVDNTAKARFIQFLTGKETGAANIKNTTIYKRVRSPFGYNDRKLIDDLQFIRAYFEDLGLKPIAETITKEINTKTN